MKIKLSLLHLFMLSAVLCLAGCGQPGGTEGDANDPAAETDAEQMEEETGEV